MIHQILAKLFIANGQGEGYLANRRVPRTSEWIVFFGGINLILIQWILVRELTTLLLGTELVVLLVSVAYFTGLSVGYYVSAWIKDQWFALLGIVTLILHLSLPIWFRFLVIFLDQASMYWVAFFVLPILTPFVVSAFYSILLPCFADTDQGDVPTLYLYELLGSVVGVLTLLALGSMGLTNILLAYTLTLLSMLILLRIDVTVITITMIISVLWVCFFPTFNKWSNALWYQQLRHLPENTSTLFTSYSPYQKIDVMQDTNGDRYLYLDGLLHFGTNRWSRLNVMMGSVPADLLHPHNSLVVGAGSMQLERLIADHGGHVTTVELDPVVVQASTEFFADYNLMNTLTNRAVVIDDAKHFVANTTESFDLIVTDVPAAFAIQTATLYSVPFYESMASRLTNDGVLVVNLTTRLKEDNLVSRRIAASLLQVFDDVIIVTSESSRLSYAFAGNHLPFDFIQLQDVLESNGESAYKLLHHDAIESIVRDAKPITLDSMDFVLQVSADWIADRLNWR
jgi:spermidine synthase